MPAGREVCLQQACLACRIAKVSAKDGKRNSQTTRCAVRDPGRLDFTSHQRELLGKLDFLVMVRGYDDPVYTKLLRQYAALDGDYRPKPARLRRNHLSRFEDAIWIVECLETCKQGTGFFLEGFGLVTCHHVVGTASYAYHPSVPDIQYPIQVIVSDEMIDLARLTINTEPSF